MRGARWRAIVAFCSTRTRSSASATSPTCRAGSRRSIRCSATRCAGRRCCSCCSRCSRCATASCRGPRRRWRLRTTSAGCRTRCARSVSRSSGACTRDRRARAALSPTTSASSSTRRSCGRRRCRCTCWRAACLSSRAVSKWRLRSSRRASQHAAVHSRLRRPRRPRRRSCAAFRTRTPVQRRLQRRRIAHRMLWCVARRRRALARRSRLVACLGGGPSRFGGGHCRAAAAAAFLAASVAPCGATRAHERVAARHEVGGGGSQWQRSPRRARFSVGTAATATPDFAPPTRGRRRSAPCRCADGGERATMTTTSRRQSRCRARLARRCRRRQPRRRSLAASGRGGVEGLGGAAG
jgi:hypothetical protein